MYRILVCIKNIGDFYKMLAMIYRINNLEIFINQITILIFPAHQDFFYLAHLRFFNKLIGFGDYIVKYLRAILRVAFSE